MKFRRSAYWAIGSSAGLAAIAVLASFVTPQVAKVFVAAGQLDGPRPPAPTPAKVVEPERTAQAVPATPELLSVQPVKAPGATPAPAMAKTQPVFMTVPQGAFGAGTLRLDNVVLPFEPTVRAIENAPISDGAKAQAMFDLLPRVPEEMLANTAEQAAALLRDSDYNRVALPWLLNPRTHGQVLGALMADLMKRPDAVALPALVDIAKDPDHPLAPSAHDNLTLLVGKDFGGDWPAWNSAVLQKLNTPAPPP